MIFDKTFHGNCHFCHENGHLASDCLVKQKSKAYSKGGTYSAVKKGNLLVLGINRPTGPGARKFNIL